MLIQATNHELIEVVRIGENRVTIASKDMPVEGMTDEKIIAMLAAAMEVSGWFEAKGWDVCW